MDGISLEEHRKYAYAKTMPFVDGVTRGTGYRFAAHMTPAPEHMTQRDPSAWNDLRAQNK